MVSFWFFVTTPILSCFCRYPSGYPCKHVAARYVSRSIHNFAQLQGAVTGQAAGILLQVVGYGIGSGQRQRQKTFAWDPNYLHVAVNGHCNLHKICRSLVDWHVQCHYCVPCLCFGGGGWSCLPCLLQVCSLQVCHPTLSVSVAYPVDPV
jgi:hypothetical protein